MTKNYLSINKDCIAEVINDEMIILHQLTGKYHELNRTGKFIFETIKENIFSIEELVNYINLNFEDEVNYDEIDNFLNDLIKRNIIIKNG